MKLFRRIFDRALGTSVLQGLLFQSNERGFYFRQRIDCNAARFGWMPIFAMLLAGGAIGSLGAQSTPMNISITRSGGNVIVRWSGGTGPNPVYQPLYKTNLLDDWQKLGATTTALSTTIPANKEACYYNVTTDVSAPTTPTGLTVTTNANSATELKLTWGSASDNTGGAGVNKYNIYRDGVRIKQVKVPSVTLTDTGLTPETTYSYSVSSVDVVGNQSALSTTVSKRTPKGQCTYALSPTSASVGAIVTGGSVSVTAGTGCAWSASSSSSWITITSGASGSGNGYVYYSVDPNTATTARTGYLTIAGRSFAVTQAGAVVTCSYTISPTSTSVVSGANNGYVSVTAGSTCSWTASSSYGWITITSGGSGTGNGTVYYSVAANTSTASRTGYLTIAGQSFAVTQAGAAATCSYALAPTSASVVSGANNGYVSVTAGSTCSWTASSSYGWITITSGGSGTGNGTVYYSVAANTSTASRTGYLTIAGQSFAVTQAGAAATCSYTLSPTSSSVVDAANNGTANVTAAAGCVWTASSSAGWISIYSGTSGNGNGTVYYTVTANTATTARTGYLTVAGQSFAVTQAGAVATCSYTISPTSASVVSGANNGTVNVTAATGCAWAATSSAGWISIYSGTSGNGNGTVYYSVTANTATTARTGYLTIAGQTFTVTQAAAATMASNWAECAGGAAGDRGTSVAVDSAGNTFVTGYFSGTADFGGTSLTSLGASDMFVAKYSAGGAVQWAKRFGGTGSTVAPMFISIDGSGNIVVVGHFSGTADFGRGGLTSAAYDIFLAEYLPDGTPRWSKRFGGAADEFVTGAGVDKRNGEILVAGTFTGTSDFSGGVGTALTSYYGGTDCFLARYSASGDHIWSKNFLNISSDRITALAVDDSGSILLTGTTDAFVNFGGQDLSSGMFLVKLDSAGAHQWSKALGNASPKALAVDSTGNIILTGTFGTALSVGGATLPVAGSTDIFLAKYSSSGSHVWSKGLGGAYSDYVCAVAVDLSGNIFLLGNFYYATSLGGSLLTGAGWDDVFVAKYSNSGTHVWSQAFGGSLTDVGAAITVDGAGGAIATGVFQSTASFIGQSLISVGANDIFVFRYQP